MRKKFTLNVDVIENKKKIFVHINKKPSVIITEREIRRELSARKINVGTLKTQTDNLFVFDFIDTTEKFDDLRITDLTESYGASELPVFIPEEEPKPTRKTTARKPRTRRKTSTTSKQTDK